MRLTHEGIHVPCRKLNIHKCLPARGWATNIDLQYGRTQLHFFAVCFKPFGVPGGHHEEYVQIRGEGCPSMIAGLPWTNLPPRNINKSPGPAANVIGGASLCSLCSNSSVVW